MPQSLSRILLHLIFSTKNRVSCFTDSGVRKDLHGYLAGTANHALKPRLEVIRVGFLRWCLCIKVKKSPT